MNKDLNINWKDINAYMIRIRRKIHEYPEPSTQEFETQKLIINELEKMGISEIKKYFNTGVVAIIRGENDSSSIGIRADIDALLMKECTGLPFESKNEGVSHSCGHDGHTAILLALARVLNDNKNKLEKTVKLIFQPAEENGPEGGGAQYMIKEGVLIDEPKVESMFALHVDNAYPVGSVISKSGAAGAGSDPFYLDVYGKGGHASRPDLLIDPIIAASEIVLSLQTIISRNINPFDSAVIGISMIQAGTRHNIVPDHVHIRGTIRTFEEETRQYIGKRINEIVKGISIAKEVDYKLDIKWNYGPMKNEKNLFENNWKKLENYFGEENCILMDHPKTGGEDFSYFAKEVPSFYFWIGSKPEGEKNLLAHSPDFTFNEKALEVGLKAFLNLVI